MKIKYAIAILIICLFANAFAQGEPKKLVVYVSGASNTGISKSLENKLLAAFVQSGNYAEIGNAEAFQSEVANGGGMDWVVQVARQHGADFVCFVSIAEAFDVYSVFARIVDVASSQAVKTASVDSQLKSMEDLMAVSDELARQLIQSSPPAPAAVVTPQKQCERTYNINELLFKVKDGFPTQLKDCSSKLAKDMLTPASLGGHKLEPVSFMKQCSIDGIKKELPEGFPGLDKFIASLTNFVHGIVNAASVGGTLDPKKLMSVVGSIDINGLLSEAKNLASGECVVDEPYTPPAVPEGEYVESGSGDKKDKSAFSLGIRIGANASNLYETYDGKGGSYSGTLCYQGGIIFDIAVSDWFYMQPGIMFIKKGARYFGHDYYYDYILDSYYFELPLLVSLKLWALRLNAGPYLSFGGNNAYSNFDLGVSMGGGFDIWNFYIGIFYDHGLQDISKKSYFQTYNRTFGFNLGYNI